MKKANFLQFTLVLAALVMRPLFLSLLESSQKRPDSFWYLCLSYAPFFFIGLLVAIPKFLARGRGELQWRYLVLQVLLIAGVILHFTLWYLGETVLTLLLLTSGYFLVDSFKRFSR